MLRTRKTKRPSVQKDRDASRDNPEVLSVAQMKSRYKSRWILIKDPIVDKNLTLVRGQVVFHSKDRAARDRKAIELRLKHSAFLYTGKMPERIAINL